MLKAAVRSVVLIGKESVGKSSLAASLTGAYAYSANFRGSTLACESYPWGRVTLIDTPGVDARAGSEAARDATLALEEADVALLVVPSMHPHQDLCDLLPLAAGKHGIVAVTFRDKDLDAAPAVLPEGLRAGRLDGRHVSARERETILDALDSAAPLPGKLEAVPASRRPRSRPRWWTPIAAALLLLPALAAVITTNRLAGALEGVVPSLLAQPVEWAKGLAAPLAAALAGPYGFLTMGPLLFVWAAPVVILYSLLLAVYKASGLIDWIAGALDPLVRPFGLTGRDLPRILMGFGCNVPAVIATRSCSVSGRNTCISAISFGSACSYQFGAMLSVFAAAGQAWLVAPYLLYLAATTLLYSRWISRRNREDAFQVLTMDRIILLEWPRTSAVWREVCGTIGQFFFTALPVFLAISMLASALDFLGILQSLTRALEPSLGLFRLPGEAAIAIVMGSIRKDGILLLAGPATATAMTPVQVLTAAYLAGVLLPCLVTWLTVARERTLPHAARMSAQQALAACLFAALLAWGGFLLA